MRQPTGDNTLAGYVRQSSADIIPTATVRAAPINAEYNKLRDAFAISSGHKHDGSTGEGGYIPLIGDVDALNKVVIDTSNNRVGVFVEVSSAAVEQVRFQDGVILPVTTNDIDLGSSSAKFKDLHLQGTATLATVDINAGNIDGTILGASTPTTATFTSATLNNNLTVTGTSTLVGTTTITSVDLNSGAIDNAVIGSATPVAGTFTTLNANTSLVAATADINGGTLDGATVGASVPSTGAFTTLTASGTSTLTTVDINGGNIDGTVIGASATAAGSFTTLSTSGQATLATADINGGSIDGSTIGASSASTGAFTTLTSSGGITGNVTGNLTGNVTGNVTGDVTGNVTGNLTGNVTAGSGTSTFTNVTIDGTLNMNAGTSATIQNLTAPTNDLDAATKKYVDDEISGLIGDAGAGLDTLGELADALNDDDDFSTTVTNSIATKLPKAGGTMTGAIAMSTNKITGAGDPTSAQDVATKAYTDTQRDTRVAKTGDTMSGALAMGNNKITGLATPTAGTDVTNKTYVDAILGSATVAATSATNAATSETNAATSATNAATSETNAATSATNAASSYDQFDDRYLGAKSSAPTVDNDGDALITGALYFNSTSNIMYVYGGSGWQAAGSSVNGTSERNTYTATAGQTVFAAAYDTGYIDVYLNGVKLLAGTDFTATNGTSITLASGASVNDVVDIVAYGTFALADHYTRTASDARYVQPTHTGNLNITGTVTSDGLTVDGDATIQNTGNSYRTFTIGANRSASVNTLGRLDYDWNGTPVARIHAISGTDATNKDNGDLVLSTSESGTLKQRIFIDQSGDISFYEDTGTTAKFFWDSSAESLGIGTSSPSQKLHISDSAPFARLESTSTSYNGFTTKNDSGNFYFGIDDSGGNFYGSAYARAIYADGAYPVTFYTNATERMRIDSSGNVGIGTDSPNAYSGYTTLTLDGTSGSLLDFEVNGTHTGELYADGTTVFGIQAIGSRALNFKTNNEERMRIDASGNVGIGTSSELAKLSVASPDSVTLKLTKLGTQAVTGNAGAKIEFNHSQSTNDGADGDSTSATIQAKPISSWGGVLTFATKPANGTPTTAPTERMTIDSAGNVLVGTTDTDPYDNSASTGFGIALRENGSIYNSRYQATPIVSNRIGNDGGIMQFRKDGATVGSIQSRAGVMTSLVLNPSGSDGAGFTGGSGSVLPTNATGLSDNAINLGVGSYRYKDLYLSGGVYLGGTGSANKLDDYEEGTWTPTAVSNCTIPTIDNARYTKVGNIVHLSFWVKTSNTASNIVMSGLPFEVTPNQRYTGAASDVINLNAISSQILYLNIYFYNVPTGTNRDLMFGASYKTNS